MSVIDIGAGVGITVGVASTSRNATISIGASARMAAGPKVTFGAAGNRAIAAVGGVAFANQAGITIGRIINLSASSSAMMSGSPIEEANYGFPASAIVGVAAFASFTIDKIGPLPAAASSSMAGSAAAYMDRLRTIILDARASAGFRQTAFGGGSTSVLAGAGIKASVSASLSVVRRIGASAGFNAIASAVSPKIRNIGANSRMLVSASVSTQGSFFTLSASTNARFFVASSAISVGMTTSAGVSFGGYAGLCIELADGTQEPGGGTSTGLHRVLRSGLSGSYPFTFAETPSGNVLIANGVGPMYRWEPRHSRVRKAGVPAPAAPLALGGDMIGTLTGDRIACYRYLDADGFHGPLSPISNRVKLGIDGNVSDVICNLGTGETQVYSIEHGLKVGSTEVLMFDGVNGLGALNGTHTVVVKDVDHFVVQGLTIKQNLWTDGGTWTYGVGRVIYSGLPQAPEEADRIQILRNLEGTMDCLYVDIDSSELGSNAFASTKNDVELASCQPVALSDGEGLGVTRTSPPPAHKPVVITHAGRAFAAGTVSYSEGCARLRVGSSSVEGVGVDWPSSFVGLRAEFAGVPGVFTIEGILNDNHSAPTLRLDSPIPSTRLPYANYSIFPDDLQRKLVYYSDADGRYESWPEWQSFAVPDDGDGITGLFSSGTTLYVIESAYIYRVVMSGDTPAKSGTVFLAARRGCVSQRCFAVVQGVAYMLDEQGVHSFTDEGDSEPLSDPIQNVFQPNSGSPFQVDWTADRRLWNASVDRTYQVVRFAVHFVGDTDLNHCLCYSYTRKQWWVEEYPYPINATANASLGGVSRVIAGTDARRVICLWDGALDLTDPGSVRSSVGTTFSETQMIDVWAHFTGNLSGIPLSVSFNGTTQTRIISDNTATRINVVDPFDPIPPNGARYQVGGIRWEWSTPYLRLSDDQESNSRDLELVYRSTDNQGFVSLVTHSDQRPNPIPLGYTQSNSGVSTAVGSPEILVDVAKYDVRPGYAIQKIEGHRDAYAGGAEFIAVTMSGVQGQDVQRIHSLTVNGASDGSE